MRSKAYCIRVAPISWQRVVRNKNRFYDGQARDRVSFGLYLGQQHNEEPLFENPIHLDVTFYMPIHKSTNLRCKSTFHTTTPHLDNLVRFFLDFIKGIVIPDDSIICSLSAKKVYDKEPRTELTITEVV